MSQILQNADLSLLELSNEKENKVRSAMADLYYKNPDSCDFIEAIMNRITRLENTIRLQGRYIDALYGTLHKPKS